MKYFNIFFSIFLIVGCSSETKNINQDVKQDNEEIHLEEPKDSEKEEVTRNIDTLINDKNTERVKKQLKTDVDIELLSFYEEQLEDFFAFDYAFKVLADSSEFHNAFLKELSWHLKEPVKDFPESWEKTSDSVTLQLNNEYQKVLKEWIPIHYYNNELTFYNPGDFNGGYYLFTDSYIYDYSFMDGPYVYKYESIDSTKKDVININFKDVESKEVKSLTFYFINKDMVVIQHQGKFINNKTGYILAVPIDRLYDFPLITTMSAELPMGVQMEQINFDSLTTLEKFK